MEKKPYFNTIRALGYCAGLAISGFILAMAMHGVLAAWTAPTQNPPDGNVSLSFDLQRVTDIGADTTNAIAVNGLTLNGAMNHDGGNIYANQTTNNRFYLDSKRGFQIRLDADNNENASFAVNSGTNQELLTIDENGYVTLKNNYAPTANKHVATKDYVDAAVAAAGGGSGGGGPTAAYLDDSTRGIVSAAQFCRNLSASADWAMDGDTSTTYDDWRLPSADDAYVFLGVGSLTPSSGRVWTSTPSSEHGLEGEASDIVTVDMGSGYWYGTWHTDNEKTLCVR